MQIVLLTGFEPFDQDRLNPSWEAVRQLDGVQLGGDAQIVARRLPCAFATAGECLTRLIDELHPAMVIATGLGPGRSDISVERVAININDARIPDNLGEQPIDTAVVAEGPAAYFTTLPIKAMVKAVRDAGIAASVSQTAGTFVCNQIFYLLQHALAGSGVRSGFIHVPLLPEQVTGSQRPSMALDTMVAGLQAAVLTAWQAPVDIKEAGGQVS
ncbi:pyroglutamyl-peptidase I [Pseudomonas lurida]|jgi:pyroglutamyl-peptidase|uniref:Pyrrolidone-carboxylate peptidase n=1 Tax=Pseudomonas lurida TaxID=244566 RepID=A0ABY9FPI9_9PSED|nr:pyroglutamyl-peptidase I [Pseudomonas lurida]VVM59370.1 Pyrrolidone-carboxylate peptidase [Pseudomonas fluorescens]MBC3240900.1 pyroglutamyl-peptidase I [Pseudomonas lurida]MBC3926030.1 pyroglutamyl-peptidase I [Pseudomonas lurida]MBD8670762.1 pyroglutamyl-peptidase I [Pseudomonas lurida]UZQ73804.1 pyroglutamyl-peptidase I [Pseudomonas lurida]